MRSQTKKNGRELLVILSLRVEHAREPGEETRIKVKIMGAIALYDLASTLFTLLSQCTNALRSRGDPYTDRAQMFEMKQI